MPKLKYDLALARHDDLVYGIPDDHDPRKKAFLLHGVEALRREPDEDPLTYYARIAKGTAVAVKLTLDDGTPVGCQRVVILVDGEDEIFTGDWTLE